jgi:predicted nucleotidyltransferase
MKYGIQHADLEKLLDSLRQHPEIVKVVLFGSRAKGSYKPGSDIDLAISFDSPISFNNWLNLQIEMDELDLPQKIDLLDAGKIENPDLLAHIQRVGKVLFERF